MRTNYLLLLTILLGLIPVNYNHTPLTQFQACFFILLIQRFLFLRERVLIIKLI